MARRGRFQPPCEQGRCRRSPVLSGAAGCRFSSKHSGERCEDEAWTQGAWLSPMWFHYAITSPPGVHAVPRNLIPDAIPPTAGCSPAELREQRGHWKDLGTAERAGAAGEAGGAPSCWAHSLHASAPAGPDPALFCLQDHIPVPYQPDSSSNPSSTTSSTPSSPAPPLPPSATPPSPLHPSPQCTRQQKNFTLPGTSGLGHARG